MERDTAAARVIYLQLSGDKLRQWPSCRWHSTRTASTSCCAVYQEQSAVLQQMQQLDFGVRQMANARDLVGDAYLYNL